jgi:RNA polymerase sigma-70 factor (ECF subfamily)
VKLSDHDIIVRIQSGEGHLYARLVDRYKDRSFSLALRLLKNREDAEEVLQDAFVRAYNSLGKFEERAKFSTWFYRIVYNVCLTKLGRRGDDVQFSSYDEELPGHYEISGGGSPAFEDEDRAAHIRRCIELLPEKYAVALTLFYIQEQSMQEIGDILNLPESTIKTHLFRARALLKEKIMNEMEELV